MARRIESVMLAGPAGALEALLEEPEDREPTHAALVCHPHPLYGGTMHNKAVYRLARGLRAAGAVVLRFNYRGVSRSKGSYAHGEGELEDAAAALAWLLGRYPGLPWLLAGFSFGARIAQRLGCRKPGAVRLILAGYPAALQDTADDLDCRAPRVFVQSIRDQYGPVDRLQSFYDRATGPRQLVWIDAGDHFFTGALDRLESVAREVGGIA